MIGTAAAWIAEQMRGDGDEVEGNVCRSITYTTAAGSVTLSATLGKTDAETTEWSGKIRAEHSDRDYLVTAAHLVIAAATVTPKVGDKITDGTETYTVNPPAAGEPPFVAGYAGITLRIHTKKTGG
jgi:DsbC/DsbD-like thiol-disulfide interchange protein